MDTFENKVVVITGGATGIGFALANRLGQEGAHIVVAEPRVHRLAEAVDKLRERGVTAQYFECDVTDPEAVEKLADFAWSEEGRVDVLMNNAGIASTPAKLIDTPLENLRQTFEVNVFGVWHGCAVFAKRMIKQGTPAAIYNTASENALFTAIRDSAAYVASKHAVLGLSDALRDEVPDFLHVGTIFPGFVQSELVPEAFLKYGMDTDYFAAVVVEQMRVNARFVVSHAYNMENLQVRFDAFSDAYATYAPRYDGDDEYDSAVVVKRLIAESQTSNE